jgi:hypothetical protein
MFQRLFRAIIARAQHRDSSGGWRSCIIGGRRTSSVERQNKTLDWDAVLTGLRPLAELKGQPEIVDRLLTLHAV